MRPATNTEGTKLQGRGSYISRPVNITSIVNCPQTPKGPELDSQIAGIPKILTHPLELWVLLSTEYTHPLAQYTPCHPICRSCELSRSEVVVGILREMNKCAQRGVERVRLTASSRVLMASVSILTILCRLCNPLAPQPIRPTRPIQHPMRAFLLQ